MLYLAIDNLPNQSQPFFVATTTTKSVLSSTASELYGTAGVCFVSSSVGGEFSSISPAYESELVFDKKNPTPSEKNEKYFDVFDRYIETATVEVLQPPMHGVLKIANTESQSYVGPHSYQYNPTDGYKGNDKVVFLVNIAGKKIEVIYFFKVLNTKIDWNRRLEDIYHKYCPSPYQWVISLNVQKDATQKEQP